MGKLLRASCCLRSKNFGFITPGPGPEVPGKNDENRGLGAGVCVGDNVSPVWLWVTLHAHSWCPYG